MIGYLHSIETLGAADGPGIRTVLFMQGCPYRCVFCHNPDTWDARGCALKFTPVQLFKRVARFKEYYGKAGGVTASGGEPLAQAAFLVELFGLLKKEGIHTALDTAGSILNGSVRALLNATDLVILDGKHTDPALFDRICGLPENAGGLQKTLDFLSLCAETGKRVWLRQVTVPGYTDGAEQVARLRRIADAYGAERVELLPYHTAGVYKWDKLGIPYPLAGVEPPSEECMRRLNEVIAEVKR
ncbi:MAG: pyruvate formate lyase-activating protein [Clostridiales bacterium]|jgi:pyruvate formate lyase activating enzyme|nr:pyruvate formate lyase-activating protein [Clostridiales bacterium]